MLDCFMLFVSLWVHYCMLAYAATIVVAVHAASGTHSEHGHVSHLMPPQLKSGQRQCQRSVMLVEFAVAALTRNRICNIRNAILRVRAGEDSAIPAG